jgi:hypothetical protein
VVSGIMRPSSYVYPRTEMDHVGGEKKKALSLQEIEKSGTEHRSSLDALLLHMWKVPDSYLGRETSYPDCRYCTLN